MLTTTSSINVRGLDDDELAVEFILSARARLDLWSGKGLHYIPGGLIIDLFTQYIGVNESLLNNLLYVSIAITITCFVFLWNPLAVFVVLLCDAAMITEVYGFIEWAGLRVNGVLALNIVIAIGLTMEFTAHMARAYVNSDASAKEDILNKNASDGQVRMKRSLREMFNPVTFGAITTFLGIAPIAGAEFPYFRQYYFILYLMIVVFGWLNGVIFLPVIMSLCNPAPFHMSSASLKSQSQLEKEIEMEDGAGGRTPDVRPNDDEEEHGGGNTGNTCM